MEPERGANHLCQQGEEPTPLRCPRCDSSDTKFRYFNNHNFAQPRHYCRTCKRQWTVGGNLRNIPIGGNTGNAKQTKTSSSRCSQRSRLPHIPLREEQPHDTEYPAPVATMAPQNCVVTNLQPVKYLPAAVLPLSSYYFNDEISCLDAIQSLIDPEVNQQGSSEYQYGYGPYGGTRISIPQRWSTEPIASQQASSQQIPRQVEYYQTHDQCNNLLANHSFSDSLVQPTWPVNSIPQNIEDNFSFSTSNASLWNNSGGTIDDEMNTEPVNVDEWLNFPCDGSI